MGVYIKLRVLPLWNICQNESSNDSVNWKWIFGAKIRGEDQAVGFDLEHATAMPKTK